MEVSTIEYSYGKLLEDKQFDKEFKQQLKAHSNVVYFFFSNDKCLYIGESQKTLYERCYVHEKPHSKRDFFKEANKIIILSLGQQIDDIARQTIEGVLILSYRPPYNKKG